MADFVRRRSGLVVPPEHADDYRPRSDCSLDPLFFGMMASSGGLLPTTLDPNNKSSSGTLSNGNLTLTTNSTTAYPCALSTNAVSSGKYYFEVSWDSGTGTFLAGVALAGIDLNNYLGSDIFGWGISQSGFAYHSGASTSVLASFTAPYVSRVAIDIGAQMLWFGNAAGFSGDPAAGTGAAFFPVVGGAFFVCISLQSSGGGGISATARLLPSSWSHAAPSGFGPAP